MTNAKKRYKEKIEYLRVELYPTDEDIKNHLHTLDEPKSTYIKKLIRKDIGKEIAKKL